VGAGTLVSNGGRLVPVSWNSGKTSAPAATIATHEQQTRIPSIIPKTFGIAEDCVLVVSINMDLLKILFILHWIDKPAIRKKD
jgi:hypothetical protein